MPSRSARHLGMNAALGWARDLIDESDEEDGPWLQAIRLVDEYWCHGEGNPDLENFFMQAEDELKRMNGESYASIASVKINVGVIVDLGDDCCSFVGCDETHLTKREIIEALRPYDRHGPKNTGA